MTNITPRPPSSLSRFAIEALEARIAPAAIASPGGFTYTDGNGDVVKVQITGKTGTVEFLDANGADVATGGGDIAQIIITKPSPDFALTFADTNTGGVGPDNEIDLGVVTGPAGVRLPIIKGIFTAASSPGVVYHLGGFIGTDFAVGGGLTINGDLAGDGVTATPDLDLKSLIKGASINLRDGVASGASVNVAGVLGGNVKTGELAGDASIGSIAVTGLFQVDHISGTLTLQKDLLGKLVLGTQPVTTVPATPFVSEEVTIKGLVAATGVINAPQDLLLHVTKDMSGSALVGGDLTADITGGLKGASLTAGNDISLTVTGAAANSSIVAQHQILTGTQFLKGLAGSSLVGGTGLDAAVTGNVAKSRFSGGTADLVVSISGKTAGSQFLSGGDASVTATFAVDSSSILADGRLTLNVGTPPVGAIPGIGDLTKSVVGSKSDAAMVNIGGKAANSQFTAATDLDVTVGKTLSASVVQSGNDLTLSTAFDVVGSRIAVGSDANVTIGGQLAGSALLISNNLTATIGTTGGPIIPKMIPTAGISKSRLETSDGSSFLTVVGPVTGSVIDSGQNATLSVANFSGLDPITNQPRILKPGAIGKDVFVVATGDISVTDTSTAAAGPKILAGHDAVVNVAGAFTGAINTAHDLDFTAASVSLAATGGTATVGAAAIPTPVLIPGGGTSVNIAAKAGIRVGGDLKFNVTGAVVAPIIDVVGNVANFHVGGAFTGGLSVGGNFVAGTTTSSATVIGGLVASSSFIHVGGNVGDATSSPGLIFAKGFGGRIEINGQLLTDLTFGGAVTRLAIDGAFGPTALGDSVADIIVHGKLGSLSAGGVFTRVTANGGNFINAAGVTTGVINADGGAAIVGPFLS